MKTPPEVIEPNKEEAISRAITEADRTGQPTKQIVSTQWEVVSGDDPEQVYTLGRFSACSMTCHRPRP